MQKIITLIKGDGIGPEVTEATQEIINASGANVIWEEVEAGSKVIEKHGTPLPEYVIDSIKKNKVALKGPITTPVGVGFRSVNVALRQKLNLYANLRPIKSYEGIKTIHKDLDFIVVRENTEGLYSGIEHKVGEEAAESIKIITKKASERIAKFAFDLAVKENRKKVTIVHKANIMKLSDGLFLDCSRKISKEYPQIYTEDVIVDAMSMNLVMSPQKFEIIVTTNLYGDILSDLSAGLVGGLGMTPSANIGDDASIFEPVHGSAPDIAGKGIANPTASILAGVMMLKYIDMNKEAQKIERSLTEILKDGRYITKDLGGELSTKDFVKAIINNM